MDPETYKAIGTLFLAIVNSLTDDHRTEICATIKRAANNRAHSAENREFFKALHHAATGDLEQLKLEIECAENGARPRLTIVTGEWRYMSRFALVIDNNCAGFVLARRHQYEAFDADEVSLGLFETEDGAVAAITQRLSVTKST